MLRPEIVKQLKDAIPAAYHAQAFVAGGYASDPEKADDVDLWILNVPPEEFDEVEKDIRGYLIYKKKLSRMAPFQVRLPYEDAEDEDFRVVFDGYLPEAQKPLQIIITCQPTPLHLLRRFDITTHGARDTHSSRNLQNAFGPTKVVEVHASSYATGAI